MKDGVKEGYGRIEDNLNKQIIYEGEWENDNYHGKGKLIKYKNNKIIEIYEG